MELKMKSRLSPLDNACPGGSSFVSFTGFLKACPNSTKFTRCQMKYKGMLLFFCATIVWCAPTTVAFGQDPAKPDNARLRAYTTVMPRSGPGLRSGLRQPGAKSPMLPLWTFDVSSTRDHNNYSGVMVGRNPFGREQTNKLWLRTS